MTPFQVSLKCLQCQHPAYVLLQNYSESGHVVHQIKENEEKKTCPDHHPTSHTPKQTLHIHCQAKHQENQRFPKPIEVNKKNRLPTCEHKLSHFEPTTYLKSKLQIQNTIRKLLMSTTTVTGYTFLSCTFECMGLGTEMLDANTQPVMAKVTDIFASNLHNLVKNHVKEADVQLCIATGQIRDICILTALYPFFLGFRGHNRHSPFGAGTHSVSKRHLIFSKNRPFMTFRSSDGVEIHLATAK